MKTLRMFKTAVLLLLTAFNSQAQTPLHGFHPGSIVGEWTYRSFHNDPDISKPFNDLEFGKGTMTIRTADNGVLKGTLDFGDNTSLNLDGTIFVGDAVVLRFQGTGTVNGEEWVYEYAGYKILHWADGVNQVPALVGSILRVNSHSQGNSPEGEVASWIAVKAGTGGGMDHSGAMAMHDSIMQKAEEAKQRLKEDWTNFFNDLLSKDDEPAPPPSNVNRMEREGVLPAPQRFQILKESDAGFVEPVVYRSEDGVLNTTLVTKYADNMIGEDPVYLRSYNGSLVGPTWRVKPGDLLRVVMVNELPEEATHTSEDGYNGFHGWNTTNLHTHGLHVSPAGNSDNVLLEIEPGMKFVNEIYIPEDHPSGTFWYHAHKHGGVAAQVGSGMAGALIIEGGMDEVKEIADAKDLTFVFQQIPYYNEGLPKGVIEYEYADDIFGPDSWDDLGRYTTINGVIQPTIRMQPGEIQRWRFIQTGIRESLQIMLKSGVETENEVAYPFYEISYDGLPLGKKNETEMVELWPGYRCDVLFQAPDEPGEYTLIDESSGDDDSMNNDAEPRKYLAKVIVEGRKRNMRLPSDESLKQYRLPSIPPGNYGKQVAVYQILPGPEFVINGRAYDPNYRRVLKLGTVDEWTIQSKRAVHPFHIHVNPFEIYSMLDENGEETLEEGETIWRDTVIMKENWTIKFRMRYETYIGEFVQHCHILDHEDQGMMELVDIEL